MNIIEINKLSNKELTDVNGKSINYSARELFKELFATQKILKDCVDNLDYYLDVIKKIYIEDEDVDMYGFDNDDIDRVKDIIENYLPDITDASNDIALCLKNFIK